MSELIKSILVFQEAADYGTALFCTLSRKVKLGNLPCHNQYSIPCTYCMFAVGQQIKPVIKSMKRVCEKPK